jgi:hypothetical protein
MNTRYYQIVNKLLQEIDVIEDLIEGFNFKSLLKMNGQNGRTV